LLNKNKNPFRGVLDREDGEQQEVGVTTLSIEEIKPG
jgi:hypothetical protein